MGEIKRVQVPKTDEIITVEMPNPTASAEIFKQISDTIWSHHSGRRSFADLPVDLDGSDFSELNETLASIDKRLLVAGPLAESALKFASPWGEEAIIAADLVTNVRGRVSTFNWDDTTGGVTTEEGQFAEWVDEPAWSRALEVGFSFNDDKDIFFLSYHLGRSEMGQDKKTAVSAEVFHPDFMGTDYDGEQKAFVPLSTEQELKILQVIAKMGRIAFSDTKATEE